VEGSSLDQADLLRAGANEADTLVVLRQQASSFDSSFDSFSSSQNDVEGLEPEAPDARTLVTVAALSDLARTAAAAAANSAAPTTTIATSASATSTTVPMPPPKATRVVTFGNPYTSTNPKPSSAPSTGAASSSITGRHLVVEFASPDAMAHTRTALEQQTENGQELWSSVDAFVPSDLASGALVQVFSEACYCFVR